jgi:predicted cupin superfamily sugar epimerase
VDDAASVVRDWLAGSGLDWEEPSSGSFVVTLPGERKLATTCSLVVGAHSVSVNAFVVRRPDEDFEQVYRWLLERNLRSYAVSYALDSSGDVYLVGRLPLHAVTPEELDRVLGAVHERADGAFNTLLELGFATAIRKEYAWRTSRGESTRNLDAFSALLREPVRDDPRPAYAALLDLQRHPEGGWFRETWRSDLEIRPPGYDGVRSAATAIYFALHPGENSRWHTVRSAELWLWHRGGPLTLRLGGSGKNPTAPTAIRLGGDVEAGEVPQALVPPGVWQAAAPAGGEPVLVSCVVAPGFDFADFRLAGD